MGHFKTKSSIFEGFFSFLQIFSSNLQIIWKLYLIKGIKKWENMDFLTFTGYLYYKTIMSQDVSSKAQIKKFLYLRKIMFHSQDIPGFVFLTIKWFTKSVTSRWVLAGFPILGGGGGSWWDAPHHMIFFNPPPIKTDAPHGALPLT